LGDRQTLIMVGPNKGPVTGQQVAFKEAVKACPKPIVINSAFGSIFSVLRFWFELIFSFLCSGGPVYITTSRSKRGFWFRDLPVFVGSFIFRRKVINHLHGDDFTDFREELDGLSKKILDVCYGRIYLTCVPSIIFSKHYSQYPGMEIVEVPNFFSDEILKTDIGEKSGKEVNILYFSNFIPSKGFGLVCDAVELIRQRKRNVNLTLCGALIGSPKINGINVKDYLLGIEKKGLANVIFGRYGEEKLKILAWADILILPTSYNTEAFPISLIEGLAAGCFIIASSKGAIPLLLEGSFHEISETEPEAICSSIERYFLLQNKSEVRITNREFAVKKYSQSSYRQNMKNIFSSISKDGS
jgi:glycosyltransferase involved in cell wall biosynthesis